MDLAKVVNLAEAVKTLQTWPGIHTQDERNTLSQAPGTVEDVLPPLSYSTPGPWHASVYPLDPFTHLGLIHHLPTSRSQQNSSGNVPELELFNQQLLATWDSLYPNKLKPNTITNPVPRLLWPHFK